MSIDWKKKLTSRKLWTAITDFIAMMIIAFGGTQEAAVQVTALIMAGAGVVAYIISEGLIDAANTDSALIGKKVPPDSMETD